MMNLMNILKILFFNKNIKIKIKRLEPSVDIPDVKYSFDSGFDLRSISDEVVRHGFVTPIRTGICVELPYIKSIFPFTLELQIRSRSGLARDYGVVVVNSPATIDFSYRGELIVLLTKITPGFFLIRAHDRIAQAVICPVLTRPNVIIEESSELSRTDRNDNGLGSSGLM